jgi:hypothetical protein
MTSPEDMGLIDPGGGPDEPDPEYDPAWDWWDGMTVDDMTAAGAGRGRGGRQEPAS